VCVDACCRSNTDSARNGPSIHSLQVFPNFPSPHNRKDFGPRLKCGVETGGGLVGENVTIKLDIQFIKA
jgi:hypothetical protein